MNKAAATTVLVLLFAATALAHTAHFRGGNMSDAASVGDVVNRLDTLVSTYNQHADQLPSLVASLVSGERINVHIETQDGEIVVGAVMDGARIATVKRGGVANATVVFRTDSETVTAIMSAKNPAQTALKAFNSQHISYEAHGLGRSIKFAVISTVSKVLGFLI